MNGFLPTTLYMAVSKKDHSLTGMIKLTKYLFNFDRYIGYSIRKSERQKGYAYAIKAAMLKLRT